MRRNALTALIFTCIAAALPSVGSSLATQYEFVTGTHTNAYTYDADSNRVSMTDPQGGVTAYVYDTLNRLSALTPPAAFTSGSFGFL